ncbi:MAG: hypothetical protein H6810_09885 [Phycisphaeraceae bacterium]|nr:MAG: hypothetical protein H6810_09885 [Phycisphaeraceae bacterium]
MPAIIPEGDGGAGTPSARGSLFEMIHGTGLAHFASGPIAQRQSNRFGEILNPSRPNRRCGELKYEPDRINVLARNGKSKSVLTWCAGVRIGCVLLMNSKLGHWTAGVKAVEDSLGLVV